MNDSTNPTDWGAAEIARRLARRDISSVEVVRAHIARIEAVNGQLNALVVPRFEEALREAAAADDLLAKGTTGRASSGTQLGSGTQLPPLHGVPVTLKECFHLAGTAATIGLEGRRQTLSPEDGILTRRLKAAGAIVLGKTNLPQMMIWHECDNPVYGRTNNPWDLQRTPGGSTGGEAALIAARGSPLGLGNDLGGSIRVPAHFCGIHGLKPTSLRLPRGGAISTLRGFDGFVTQPGPLARHVEDLWLALQVLHGNAGEPPAGDVAPGPLPDPAAVDVRRLKIGVLAHDGSFPASAAIVRAVREAADVLAARGATIVQYERGLPGTDHFFDIYCGLIGADGGADARRFIEGSKLDWRVARLMWIAGLRAATRTAVARGLRLTGQRTMARLVSIARPLSTDSYRQLAFRKQQLVRTSVEQLHAAGIDAILAPPHALPAMQHVKGFDLISAASYSMLFNLLGFPAGVVAATRVRPGEDHGRHVSRDQVERQAAAVDRGSVGLPVGVQVAALPWREDIVLAVMAALESHFSAAADYPGHQRVPAAK